MDHQRHKLNFWWPNLNSQRPKIGRMAQQLQKLKIDSQGPKIDAQRPNGFVHPINNLVKDERQMGTINALQAKYFQYQHSAVIKTIHYSSS